MTRSALDRHADRATLRARRLRIIEDMMRGASGGRLRVLPPEAREALRAVLLDLRREAGAKKEAAQGRHKMWTATYWHVVAVYSLHIARALRKEASTC
ncbi:MAG: hypothetical protein LT106_18725 [Burkholderiaceae bacterium]|nr:hypothetical protein [Burkholderiaceae bacterium]